MNFTKKKAAFLTLGCKVNQYETDAMKELLLKNQYEIVDFKSQADVYIIHTCSVTNMADRKSRQMIKRARRMNPSGIVVAVGCYVQAKKEELLNEGMADILIGNNQKGEIVQILEDYFEEQRKKAYIVDISREKEYESLSICNVSGHTRAYIKIQDGCNQFCSYCIIPYTRGRIRSERPERIEKEVRSLSEKGFQEVVLTGIHLSSYGKDLGNTDLLRLIGRIHDIEGISRIRLGSLEPRIITEEFVQELKKYDKVCPHFHLSLQSGCDDTLKRMNRKYTTADYENALAILRRHYDHPALTTDVIAGFVGESEEEFENTKRFLEKINLYEMHIFKYSVREGTRAQRMDGHIPEQIKTSRSSQLLSLAAANKKKYEEYFLGKKEKVLLEEIITVEGKQYYQGYTSRYVRVAVEIKEDERLEANQIVPLVICGFLDENLLLGKLLIEF